MNDDPYLKIYTSGTIQDGIIIEKSTWGIFLSYLKNKVVGYDNSIQNNAKGIIKSFLTKHENIDKLPRTLSVKVSKIIYWTIENNTIKPYQIPTVGHLDADTSILFVNLPVESNNYYFYVDGKIDKKLNLKYITNTLNNNSVIIDFLDDNNKQMDNVPFIYNGTTTIDDINKKLK
jgi:hypothetical protein